jgi:hypothetical protein
LKADEDRRVREARAVLGGDPTTTPIDAPISLGELP